MWLTGRLSPDFKTIANFRKDNGEAIRLVCREFVMLCRKLSLFADAFVAIDGSKFKAVNNRDRNFTKAKMKRRLAQIDESIERYLGQLASADRQSVEMAEAKSERLHDKIAKLKEELDVVADRGYFKGEEILACDESGITTYLPRPQTSRSTKHGLFSKRDFIYKPNDNEYECPAGERLIWRFTTQENAQTFHKYWSSSCPSCVIRGQCTSSKYRRVARWDH